MKKLYFATLLLIIPAIISAQNSEQQSDTILSVNNVHKVVICESPKGLSVNLNGKDGNPDYTYVYKATFNSTDSVSIAQSNSDLGLSFPFLNYGKKDNKAKFQIFSSGLYFGWANAIGNQNVNTSMGSSNELGWNNVIGFGYQPWRNGPQFSIGVGINWKNYRMTGKTRFIQANNDMTIGAYPEGAEIKFSRIKVFSWGFPLMVSQKLSKYLNFQAGAILNLNTYASLKTEYILNGEKNTYFSKHIHQKPVSCDLMAILNFRFIGAYVRYSPCNVLDSTYGPSFNTIATGVAILF